MRFLPAIALLLALSTPAAPQDPPTAFHATTCDASLWDHVYHGTFSTPQDRLKVLDSCITITGKIESAAAEDDGDRHIRLRVDKPFKKLLNAKNRTGQKGFLVVEPVCERKVTQKDTLLEKVCNAFHQDLYTSKLHGKRVTVTGVYVEDQEHGWREIHPVTSIALLN